MLLSPSERDNTQKAPLAENGEFDKNEDTLMIIRAPSGTTIRNVAGENA